MAKTHYAFQTETKTARLSEPFGERHACQGFELTTAHRRAAAVARAGPGGFVVRGHRPHPRHRLIVGDRVLLRPDLPG